MSSSDARRGAPARSNRSVTAVAVAATLVLAGGIAVAATGAGAAGDDEVAAAAKATLKAGPAHVVIAVNGGSSGVATSYVLEGDDELSGDKAVYGGVVAHEPMEYRSVGQDTWFTGSYFGTSTLAGKHWLHTDTEPGPADALGFAQGNPHAVLEALGSGDVESEDAGTGTVQGVAVTSYRLTGSERPDALEGMEGVSVDGAGLIREVRWAFEGDGGGDALSGLATLQLTDFGKDITVNPPLDEDSVDAEGALAGLLDPLQRCDALRTQVGAAGLAKEDADALLSGVCGAA